MIAVIDYHKGNLLSVERGLRAQGADARVTDSPEEAARAQAIVLPGVGAFTDAMASLKDLGLADVLRRRVQEGVPFLGICLGLHLMFEAGTEDAAPGHSTPGLGLIPGVVDRLPSYDEAGAFYKIPHVGWNQVMPAEGEEFTSPILRGIAPGEYFYFTHSYAAPESHCTVACTTHSIAFPCAVQVGECAFGVQFHPEKSSDAGAAVLRNFVDIAAQG